MNVSGTIKDLEERRLERCKQQLHFTNDGIFGQAMAERNGAKRARIEGEHAPAPAPAPSAPSSEAPAQLWTPDDESKTKRLRLY